MITSSYFCVSRWFFSVARTSLTHGPHGRAIGAALLLLAGSTTASAQNSNLSDHDRYIHNESERNTKYFNNADSYPKPSTNNFRSFVPPPVQSHDRSDWGRQPANDAVMEHRQTREEYFASVKQRSASGNADAKMDLADCYYQGWGVAQNKAEAYRLYREAGSTRPRALVTAASLLYNGDGMTANYAEGLALMQRAAAAGAKEAIDWLAVVHPSPAEVEQGAAKQDYRPMLFYAADLLYGRNGRELDPTKAIAYLQRAAAAGDKNSADWLDSVYPSAKAIEELKSKSAAGDAGAKEKLADCYAQGLGVKLNPAEAYRLYREAGSASPSALGQAGYMLFQGVGVTANQTEGLALVRQAVAAGDRSSATWLAKSFPSLEAAERSATQQDYEPMLRYAIDVLNGQNGRAKDPAGAIGYFGRVAAGGDTRAMLYLGYVYGYGIGVPEDPVQAEQWMLKADAAGDRKAAKDLAALAEHDTPAHPRDLATMRRWTEKYLAANPTPGAFDLMAQLEYYSGHREKARAWWLKAVEGGETDNEHELGFLEWSGQAGPVDEPAGRKHLEAAAAQGNEKSMYELGVAYLDGRHGLPHDEPRAIALFLAAAEKGVAPAQNNLAIFYHQGRGTPRDDAKAAFWAQKAIDSGYTYDLYVLATYLRDGTGVPKDPAKSAALLQQAVEQDVADATQELANYYREGFGVPKDSMRAMGLSMLAETQNKADQGDASAMAELATSYYEGTLVPRNLAKFISWTQKAADLGHASASFDLAKAYYSGEGKPKDLPQYFHWIQKAAEQGDERALYELGAAYENGRYGLTADASAAAKLYQAAGEKGNVNGQFETALAYFRGAGVAKDFAQAAQWAQKAADQGHAKAMYVLAVLYGHGAGVAKDPAKAVEWTQKSAEAGDAQGMYGLAVLFREGTGVAQDHAKYVEWLQKAANAGDEHSMYLLAILYNLGSGLPKDPAKSLAWMQKAAANGDEGAKAKIAEGYAGQ